MISLMMCLRYVCVVVCLCQSHLLDVWIWAVCRDGLALVSLTTLAMAPDTHVTLRLTTPTLGAVTVPRTTAVHLHCTHTHSHTQYLSTEALVKTCDEHMTASSNYSLCI